MSKKILVLVPSKNHFKVSKNELLEKLGFLPGLLKDCSRVIFSENKFKYVGPRSYYADNDNVFSIKISNVKEVLKNTIAKNNYEDYLEDLINTLDEDKIIEIFKKFLKSSLSGQKFALFVVEPYKITEF